MALTRQQFQELRSKGLGVEQIIAFEKGEKPSDLKSQRETTEQIAGNQFEQEKPTSFLGKARRFATGIIGGGKLAEGAGQALAAPGIQKSLSESQEQAFRMQKIISDKLRAKKAAGEDTAKFEKALKDSQNLVKILNDAQSDFAESLVSNKEVIGSALRLAGTATGGFITKASTKAFALGKATTLFSGAARGAAAGAVSGGVFGGIQGAGVGLEQEKDLKGVLTTTGLGVVGGAATGGIIGGVLGGVSGVVQGRRETAKGFVENLVAPKETAKVSTEAIRQGRFQDPTTFRQAGLQASKRDKQLADAVKDIVSPKASVGQNIDAIKLKVSNTNNGITEFIRTHKVPFNTRQLNSKLIDGKADLNLVFASDTTAEKTYNAVVKEFMKNVGKKDTLGLFKARQNFDQIPAIKKLLQSQGLGENAKREIVLAVRREANEYVASLLPKSNTFRVDLLRESHMLEALGNIAEKSVKLIGKSKFQLLVNEYPILKWVVGGLVGAAGVGVGGAIIGSTD